MGIAAALPGCFLQLSAVGTADTPAAWGCLVCAASVPFAWPPGCKRLGKSCRHLPLSVCPSQVLYSFPAAMPADLEQGLAAFCFPHGVRPELLERTPSMSGGFVGCGSRRLQPRWMQPGCPAACLGSWPRSWLRRATPAPPLPATCPLIAALNEVIYSQPYQTHDDHSFVFTMKVSCCSACGGYLEQCRVVVRSSLACCLPQPHHPAAMTSGIIPWSSAC